MDVRQLNCFIVLAEELHFQRAARRVNLTQPALSYQLKTLEEKMQASLIERDRRNVSLTPAGSHFYEGAKALVKQWQTLQKTTREIADNTPLALTLAYTGYLNLGVVNRSIMALRTAYPSLALSLLDLPASQIADAVKEGQADLGFSVLPVTHPTLKVKPLVSGNWQLVMSELHPLAQAEDISLSELAEQPLIMFERRLNPGLFDWWLSEFAKAGVSPNIVLETSQVSAALQMVRRQRAVFIVVSYVVDDLIEGVIARPFSEQQQRLQVGAIWQADNRSQGLQHYLQVLREEHDSTASGEKNRD